jgi:hypothetical protein
MCVGFVVHHLRPVSSIVFRLFRLDRKPRLFGSWSSSGPGRADEGGERV